ncbi:MAG: hypothetical protein IJB97_03115 [Clostridia bacterium]|nr:hypothetical protein [Clostridia bacterium]
MSEKMQISAWNYIDARYQGAEDVRRWKEMGLTLVMTGGVDFCNPVRAAKIAEVLEECERQGMDAIVREDQFDIRAYLDQGKEAFEKKATEALRFYEKFPAVKYVFVWDEPMNDEQWSAMGEVCSFIQNTSKKIKGFCSLNHYCGAAKKDLYEKLDRYVETCNPDILLYNCYSQCFDREEDREQGLENYFINLKLFSEYAKAHGLILATSLVCVGHWSIRMPTQDDICWQLNTAAANGVRQAYWFHPFERLDETPFNQTSYRGHPINYRGEPTAIYQPLCYENNHWLANMKGFGIYEDAKLEKVYHVFRSYGGFPYFYKGEDEYVWEIKNPYNRPLILSRFVKADGKRVLMLVNNAQRGCADVTVVFNKELNRPNKSGYLAAGAAMFIELDK